MRTRETGSIPYVLVRPPAVAPCDAFERKEMMRRVISAVHAALLGISSGAVLLITPDALAALEGEQHGPAFFVSGVAGAEQENEIKSLSTKYSVDLLSEPSGSPNEFLANIKNQIKDQYGKTMLETISEGTVLLATMPVGEYSTRADSQKTISTW